MVAIEGRLIPQRISQEILELLVEITEQRKTENEILQNRIPKSTYTSGKGTRMVPEYKIVRYY